MTVCLQFVFRVINNTSNRVEVIFLGKPVQSSLKQKTKNKFISEADLTTNNNFSSSFK